MNALIEKLALLLCTVAPEFSQRTFTANTGLRDLPGLDASALLLFALAVEDEFDIRITGSPELKTLGDVADYIKRISQKNKEKAG